MYNSLELFQTATAMARHAGSRQAQIAGNIANADTPGFRAQHIPPFREVYHAPTSHQISSTRPGHIQHTSTLANAHIATETATEPSPNGNSVSLEEELLNSVAVGREHTRALTIYRHAMTVLRTTLGRT